MEPLVTLVGVTAILVVVGLVRKNQLRRVPVSLRGGLAAMFLLTGIAHFIGLREELVAMVPPGLPSPELLVTITGIAEILGALGLLIGRTAGLAAAALTVLLLLVFPANINHALTAAEVDWDSQLLPRTIIQLVFLAATSAVALDRLRSSDRTGDLVGQIRR